MARPNDGQKHAKYPSVKAGYERFTVRLDRLCQQPTRRNYMRNRFCYIFAHARTKDYGIILLFTLDVVVALQRQRLSCFPLQ